MARQHRMPQLTGEVSFVELAARVRQASTPTVTPPAIPSYTYLGCFTADIYTSDQTPSPSPSITYATSALFGRDSPEFCCSYCLEMDTSWTWCGVGQGSSCLCQSSTNVGIPAPSSMCSSACGGSGDYSCGGDSYVNLYSRLAPITNAPPTSSLGIMSVSGFAYQGCYTDGPSRILPAVFTNMDVPDPQFCCDLCLQINPDYVWCGLELLGCMCDSTMGSSALLAPTGDCSSKCGGTAADYQCGGDWRMNAYKATAAVPSTASLTSASATTTPGGASGSGSSSKGSSSALSGGDIAGIVIGVVAFLLLYAAWLCQRRLLAFCCKGSSDPDEPTDGDGSRYQEAGDKHQYELATHQRAELNGDQRHTPYELEDYGRR